MRTSSYTFRVRFAESDAFGIVFYPNFFAYYDLAVTAMLEAGPYDFARGLRLHGLGFPCIEAGSTFHAPLFANDELTIASRVSEARTRSFRVEHVVRRGETTIATGFEVRVFAKLAPGRDAIALEAMPPALHSWLSSSAE